jgi:hypothetical protein
MANNDLEVRCVLALADIVKAAKPKARVHPWWLLGQGLGESVPDLQSLEEDEWGMANVPWVHGYMFDFGDDLSRENLGHSKSRDIFEFRFWGFYGWWRGNVEKNSAFVFSKHVADVRDALTKASKLQTDGTHFSFTPESNGGVSMTSGVKEVEKHLEWQIGKRGIYWMGDHKVHVAQGIIRVQANLLINPRPLG